MSALTLAVQVIGAVAMTAGGFGIAAGLLWLAAYSSGKYAWRAWKNLSGIYMLNVMEYWFRRMEEDGTHVLKEAYEEKLKERTDA